MAETSPQDTPQRGGSSRSTPRKSGTSSRSRSRSRSAHPRDEDASRKAGAAPKKGQQGQAGEKRATNKLKITTLFVLAILIKNGITLFYRWKAPPPDDHPRGLGIDISQLIISAIQYTLLRRELYWGGPERKHEKFVRRMLPWAQFVVSRMSNWLTPSTWLALTLASALYVYMKISRGGSGNPTDKPADAPEENPADGLENRSSDQPVQHDTNNPPTEARRALRRTASRTTSGRQRNSDSGNFVINMGRRLSGAVDGAVSQVRGSISNAIGGSVPENDANAAKDKAGKQKTADKRQVVELELDARRGWLESLWSAWGEVAIDTFEFMKYTIWFVGELFVWSVFGEILVFRIIFQGFIHPLLVSRGWIEPGFDPMWKLSLVGEWPPWHPGFAAAFLRTWAYWFHVLLWKPWSWWSKTAQAAHVLFWTTSDHLSMATVLGAGALVGSVIFVPIALLVSWFW